MIKRMSLKVNHDNRGSMTELMRDDWEVVTELRQSMLSISKPGVIRAWHRHVRGQNDRLVVIRGTVKVVLYDPDLLRFYECILTGSHLQLAAILGKLWHGTKNIGSDDSWTIYFIDKLYDYQNPDEERLPYDYEFKGGKYQW